MPEVPVIVTGALMSQYRAGEAFQFAGGASSDSEKVSVTIFSAEYSLYAVEGPVVVKVRMSPG